MKEYEAVWEIYNLCSGNQMRDVFVEEIACDNLDEFIQGKFKGEEVSWEKSIAPDGSIIYDIQTSKIKQRYSFTEI